MLVSPIILAVLCFGSALAAPQWNHLSPRWANECSGDGGRHRTFEIVKTIQLTNFKHLALAQAIAVTPALGPCVKAVHAASLQVVCWIVSTHIGPVADNLSWIQPL